MIPLQKIYSFILLLCLSSCLVGEDYRRPATEKTNSFKEAQGWKQAQPKDISIKAKWWELFEDKYLNILEEQVEISNQTVKAAQAAYQQSNALVSQTWAGLFPVITAGTSVSRNGSGGGQINNTINTIGNRTYNVYDASLATTSWEIDVWGRIRRSVEAAVANSQASAADLAAARLSAQSTLAKDYFSLRLADEQKRLLASTVANYEKSLALTRNLYTSGVSAKLDLLQAQTQLDTAKAQLIDVDANRTALEHAIAILIGKAPADFSLVPLIILPAIPAIPLALPSDLLERRPDIAAAERLVIAANANIGVAKAAFYPQLSLSGSIGYQSSVFSNLFSMPNRVWSVGPALAQPLFDAGLRSAQTKAAKAAYDQSVANYRQTVLSAFGEVEDNMAALRVLGDEANAQQSAVSSAQATSIIFLNQYKSGIVNYLSVVTAQNTELTNKLTMLAITKQRFIAAATLITALGGGWDNKEAIETKK